MAVKASHYLLPYERRAAERVVEQSRVDRRPDVLRREYNLGPEGIRLGAAADSNALPGVIILCAGALVAAIAAAVRSGPALLVSLGILGPGLAVMLLAVVRQAQAMRAGRAHRGGRRYLLSWESPPEIADESGEAGGTS